MNLITIHDDARTTAVRTKGDRKVFQVVDRTSSLLTTTPAIAQRRWFALVLHVEVTI